MNFESEVVRGISQAQSGGNGGNGRSVAEMFQRRVVELARTEGRFGRLRTRKASLQSSYAHWLSLLDNPAVPVLIYGDRGSGKRAHVDEFLTIQNFYRRLEGAPEGQLRVFRADFLSAGFTGRFLDPKVSSGDVIYVENVESLTLACQQELLDHLKLRKRFHEKAVPTDRAGIGTPRIVLGTEKALSLLVIRGEFLRELFQAITGFAVFLPTLSERPEDLPHLVGTLAQEISGHSQTPSPWLVDTLGRQDFAENLDDLKRLLRNGLMRTPDLRRWTEQDLPLHMRAPQQGKFELFGQAEKTRLRQALLMAGGDRAAASKALGMDKLELLRRMMALGMR
jgi:DNA-binding NtrC family response regulator